MLPAAHRGVFDATAQRTEPFTTILGTDLSVVKRLPTGDEHDTAAWPHRAAPVGHANVDRATLRSGDYFGEISCLLGEAPTADIVALGPLRCLILASSQVEAFLKSNPTVMFRLLQGEARKVRTTTKWLS